MTMGISALLLALLISLAYVDARNLIFVPNELGKSTEVTLHSSQHGQPLVGFPILSSDDLSKGFLCDSCLGISRQAETFLTDPELPKNIGELYNQACHILPSDLQVKCVETLEMYADQAISFLQTFFDEETLCNNTGLCPVASNTLRLSSFGRDEKLDVSASSKNSISEDRKSSMLQADLQMPLTSISDNRSCEACHAAMDELKNDLENPEMKLKVMRMLLKACDRVDNHVKQCKRMLLEYGPIILSNLEKYMKSNDPCRLLKICEAPKRFTPAITEDFIPLLKLRTEQSTQVLKSSK